MLRSILLLLSLLLCTLQLVDTIISIRSSTSATSTAATTNTSNDDTTNSSTMNTTSVKIQANLEILDKTEEFLVV